MSRAHYPFARSIRWTSLYVLFAFSLYVFSFIVITTFGSRQTQASSESIGSEELNGGRALKVGGLTGWSGDFDDSLTRSFGLAMRAANYNMALMPQGSGYGYRRTITIDHTKVPNTDQSNFPVLISGSYSYLKTVANGGNVQNANGYDVIFTSDTGCGTKLDHEVESYNAATGAVNYWVRVPTVSHSNDTTLYLCYGNPSISTFQENRTGVWDANFRGVWHLGNGSTLSANDSTSNANNGTINGATATAGQIGGSASFSGSSQNITTPASIRLDDAFTLSAWINLDDVTHNTYVIFGFGYNNSDNYGFLIPRADHSGLTLQSTNQGWPPGASFTTPSQNVSAATWTHVVLKKSAGSTVKIYQNGTEITNEAMRDTGYLASTLTIGSAVGANYFKGKIDEAHFSTVERSTDWIKTEYNNQSSPSTFYAISSSDGSYAYHRIITIDHTRVPNTDQINFPVLISGTYPYLATTANGGNVQNANGYDVIFTSDCGCANKLDHEVESYNAATGAVNYWVRVPTVSHTRDPIIYMCYGNAAVSTSQENKTGVWDANFKAVWHAQDGTTLSPNDSTANGNNGTITGATAAAGQIDGAASFNGSSGQINIGTTPSSLQNLAAGDLSVFAWIKPNSAGGGNAGTIIDNYNNDLGWSLLIRNLGGNANALQVSVGQSYSPSDTLEVSVDNSVSYNSWQLVGFVYKTATKKATIYKNGSALSLATDTAGGTGAINDAANNLRIGNLSTGTTRTWDGLIDEIRVSNIARSVDWIKTEYNNQSSPSTFYAVASTAGGCNQSPVANAGGPYSGLSQTSIQFNGSGSSDPDGTIASYAWDFGDGTTGTGVSPTHSYSLSGTYTVTLTVTDNSGATASATATATATNRAPVANAGGPYSALSQTSIQLNGSGSSDPDGTIASYAWNFGDGTTGTGATPTHSYSLSGTYTVTLTVTDNSGATASATATATATNRAPVANAGGPYSGLSQTSIQFNGSGSSDPDGTIASYAWNFGDGATGTGVTPTHSYSLSGTYTVTLTVTDNSGATASATATATATNRAPVANAGGPYSGLSQTSIQFNGSGSSDPDGTIASYAWNFGDGTTGTGVSPTHSYSLSGTYTVTLTVTDNLGATASATATATATNRAPVANAGGPYSGLSQTSIQFNGSGSSDPDGTIASYAWNFGDGTTGTSATPTHSYSLSGTYTVTLTVTDNSGATASATATATATNRAPVANAGGPYSGLSQTSIQFNGSGSSDPDGTIAGYAWNFGDGATGTGATPAHSYSLSGTYTVTLTVTDNSGATASATATATATNRAPVANVGGPYSGLSQTSIQFNGSGSSDPDGTIAGYAWNFGDNSSAGTGATPTHAYALPGTYTVTLTVTDNLNATATATANVTVTGISDVRLDPMNRTGGAGEDPLSRNFNWSISLVSLPGRSGLNLGLSLSYNSLATWIKSGSYISFDDDHGFPGPGFRLGFPAIQAAYYNTQASKYSFLMISPSGARMELRQVGVSNLYQAVDSSYLLLDSSTMTLRTTDGIQLSYAWMGSDYQCTRILDRNGNFISVNYDGLGRIDTVVDTLKRTVKFNYTSGDLTSIVQNWTINGQVQAHPWASFAYANQTIQTNFSGLTVIGPQNGSNIRVLTDITFTDNSHYHVDYSSWGQVWKISDYATDGHLLNYHSYDLPQDNSTSQSDCPRFTQRHDWAENWNRDGNGNPQEVTTTFDGPVDVALPDNSLATVIKTKVKSPDGTYQQTYFAGSVGGGAGSAPAWKRGLPLLTDTFDSNDTKQRSATTAWMQDDTSVAYQLNPRVIETNITDPANNHSRTRVDYAVFNLTDGTSCRYPSETYEYQADASTVLRRSHVDYLMSAPYTDTSRRILGLPSAKYVCDGAQGAVPCNDQSGTSLVSKVSFQYDEQGSIQGNDKPVQHDDANYGASLVVGRANLSSVTRYDVVNIGQFTMSSMQYNTAGSMVKTVDATNHQTQINYTDAFAANGTTLDPALSFATLAYPTSVTDPDGYSFSKRYNYDFGAATWKQTPLPNVIDNQPGPQQVVSFDSIGRLDRITTLVNNAYTRYAYGPNYVETFATVNTVADEAHSLQVFDGHGRVIAKASNHPGSVGGFSGQLFIYDQMGQMVKTSNPTETSVTVSNPPTPLQPYSWAAAGDDAQAGWVYTQQTYDWKGRPLVTTNPSTTGNPADTTTKSASYSGCGCAGGEIVTLTDEGTINSGVAKRRQQKIYSDVLGRTVKTEALNWASGTPYETTVNTYNARDQVTRVRQFEGPAPTDPNDLSCATGTVTSFGTDTSWKQTQSPGTGWQNAGFDDSSWLAAVDEGAFGVMPWSTWTDFTYNTPAHWIWYYASHSGSDTSTVYFRKTFTAPASTISATLKIVADNSYIAYLNGNEVANGSNWKQAQTVTLSLTPGASYVLAVVVTNTGGAGGLLAEIKSTGASCQLSTMSYDGYGRLQTRHVPEQQVDPLNDASTDHTTFAYNPDDTVQRVTDARGATASYHYNGRGLVTKVEYGGAGGPGTTLPTNVSATANTEFGYDAVSNRMSMSDGSGNATFHYDQLSRLDWEERTLNGLTNPYRITYAYNLAGEVNTITEPTQFGTSLGYQYDQSARLTSVTGSGYTYTDSSNSQVPVSTFASNIYYRAWNMMKDMDDGNGVHHHFNFNSRLLASDYTLSNFAGSPGTMSWNYDYYADGNINHAYDVADNHFDRAYSYDHLGRLTEGYSGREARGETIPPNTTPDSPYRHTYSYDVWSHQTSQTGRWWQRGLGVGYAYINNRQQGMSYDAAGHITRDVLGTNSFDARGARTLVTTGHVGGGQTGNPDMPAEETANTLDGDGQPTKTVVTSRNEDLIGEGPATSITQSFTTTYYLRSSVLGGYVVAEMDQQGERTKGYVYAGGERLAEYSTTAYSHTIVWQHKNPLTGSWIEVAANDGIAKRREMDPLGREVGTTAPPSPPPNPPPPSRDPVYEIEGGASGEAELGMQLYEDFYINKNYGGGAGPGQGGFWDQWHNHELEREFQLMTGGHFLFGVDKMNATSGMSGNSYELVDNGYDTYSNVNASQDENGVWHGGMSIKHVDLSYYRLAPGSGSPQKKVPLGVQFLRDPLTGGSYQPNQEDKIRGIVDRMRSKSCTEAFKAAGLRPPSELLENGVFIGPATLLLDSSADNLNYMGITERARNRDVSSVDLYSVKGFTEIDEPNYLPDTADGRPRIFLNHSAFQDGDYWLGEYLRHEFIHAGGAPAVPSLFSSDLDYLGWKHVRVGNGFKGEGIYEWRKVSPTEEEIKAACR